MLNHNYLQVALYKKEIPKSIYEVETGFACNCFCPICKSPLEAKNKGKEWNKPLKVGQRIAHFAHSDGSNCVGARESMIHLTAKEVLSECLSLKIPSLHFKGVKLTESSLFKFDECFLEKKIEIDVTYIQSDAILKKGETELYVEFYKTHMVEDSKIEKLIKLKKSTLEIDLNEIPILKDGIINKEEIRNNLVNEVGNKWWIFNNKQEILYQKHIKIKNQKKEKINDDELFDDDGIFDDMDNSENSYLYSQPIHSKENLDNWKKKLKQQGFKFLKLYRYPAYDYDFNGRKTYSHTWENVYCPKLKSGSSRKTIDISDCRNCELHKSMMKNNKGDWGVACGYYC